MSDIAIRPLIDEDAAAFKALRLKAIQDVPTACLLYTSDAADE